MLAPLPDKLHAGIDATGLPMTSRETAGRDGKGDGRRARVASIDAHPHGTVSDTGDMDAV